MEHFLPWLNSLAFRKAESVVLAMKQLNIPFETTMKIRHSAPGFVIGLSQSTRLVDEWVSNVLVSIESWTLAADDRKLPGRQCGLVNHSPMNCTHKIYKGYVSQTLSFRNIFLPNDTVAEEGLHYRRRTYLQKPKTAKSSEAWQMSCITFCCSTEPIKETFFFF